MYIDVCLIHVHKEGSLVRTLAKETSCYGQTCVFLFNSGAQTSEVGTSNLWHLEVHNFQPASPPFSWLP